MGHGEQWDNPDNFFEYFVKLEAGFRATLGWLELNVTLKPATNLTKNSEVIRVVPLYPTLP